MSLADAYSQKPISGAIVTFSDGGKQGSFSEPTAVTDSTGLASTSYTLPKKAQTVSVTITTPGAAVVKTNETSVPGPAASVVVAAGNFQTGPTSTPLPNQLVVKVRDQYVNGVPGISVTFSDAGADGSFFSNPVISDASGVARVTYTTPSIAGTFKVKAAVPKITSTATFTETVQ